jgi:hypothetical protein
MYPGFQDFSNGVTLLKQLGHDVEVQVRYRQNFGNHWFAEIDRHVLAPKSDVERIGRGEWTFEAMKDFYRRRDGRN